MSTHGRTGWQRLKLGSVAQKVLRCVPCPVFLVPPHAASSVAALMADALAVYKGWKHEAKIERVMHFFLQRSS